MEDTKTTVGAKAAEPLESADAMKMTRLSEDIGDAGNSQPADSTEPGADKEQAGPGTPAGAKKTETLQFKLKITQRSWLIAATLLMGLVMLLLFGRATGRNKAAKERQVERSIESLTPEGLIAKCGQPTEDVTKDLYPMIKRTMSYRPNEKGTLTLEFSRTAEENSEWLFLALSDENGATYGTPETQIAALPCLRK